jgi:hypothetical protein
MPTVTKPVSDLHKRADWRAVEQLYGQFAAIAFTGQQLPEIVTGALSNSLSRVLAFYEDGESQFIEDLLELWSGIDQLTGTRDSRFRTLYLDSRLDKYPEYKFPPDVDRRRRPRPFEAAVETCRRLIDVNSIRQTLSSLQTGAILGGSVSYGRFYNVTGAAPEFGSKSSDADLLLVLADYDQLASVVEKLAPIPGLEPSSLDQLRQRVTKFPQIRTQYAPCILSHKLKFWINQSDSVLSGTKIPADYSLSLHVFSLSDFDYTTLRDSSVLQPSEGASSFDRIIRDYRDTSPPESRAYDNRSFSGIALGTNPLEPVQVDLGYVAQVKVCLIQDDRYCPGLHQNLILPQFERRWESEQVRLYLRMLTFRWKILERLRTERTMRPFEEQKLSLSHVRYFVFSPHITHRADRD